ncbi:MAG: pirin family protein, partial [Bacteroidales bacterium]|nr:pirin family protein [Bacteroidales bacterium]
THDKVVVVEEPDAVVRILAGCYKGTKGVFEGKYVKVTYLDIALRPDTTWIYTGTPNNETLFIYLLDGTLAVKDDLIEEEEKACAVLFTATEPNAPTNEAVVVRSGVQGARFVLLAALPLREPIAWGGPIVMNTQEELQLAMEELDNGTFIKHKE